MRQLLWVIASTSVAMAEPDVVIGPPTFAGSLDGKHADDIDVMVKNHRDEYVKCYDPEAGELRMHVTLIVHPTGRVTGAGVALASGTSPAVACLQGVLKNLRFDAQAGKVTVDYAFAFEPPHDDPPPPPPEEHHHAKQLPSVTLGEATVTGTYDKAIVLRYIKRNLNNIRYCYEKNLVTRPDIAGKLTASFKIGSDGIVVGMKTDGFDKPVGACVAGVIKDIEFPHPTSGMVDVKYPFTFKK
ncbi:MAG: AgmX/PglI C-terminal domain-containing protein [Kofleriaceae bacterium]